MAEKVAIVTGAGTGIGKHAALALMREGFAVVFGGRRLELIEAAAAEGRATGSPALAVQADVRDPQSVRMSSSSSSPLVETHLKGEGYFISRW